MMRGDWIEITRFGLEMLGALATLGLTLLGFAHRALVREMVTKAEMASWRKEHDEEHETLSAQLARGEQRFVQLEGVLAGLPTANDVADLRIKIERLSGEIKVVTVLMERVEEPMRTIISGALSEALK